MKKKVNIDRSEISSEEIAKRKDFDSVLKNHASIGAKPLLKKPWFLSSVIIATVAIVTAILLMNQQTKQQPISNSQQLSTNEDSLAMEAFYKVEEAKPCINPPLAGCNVPYTTYNVIAEKGATLSFKTGSTMIVPKNAFADRKGNILKGKIELRYREMHDAVDFFVAGIPMKYDSAGVRYHFESAGMVEMLAYQDGQQINMAEGKSINIEMASNYAGTRYNFYELDTVKNNWTCLGKDKIKAGKNATHTNLVSEIAVADAPQTVDQTSEYKTIETKKVEVKKEKEIKISELPKSIVEPVKPGLAKKNKYTFNIEVEPTEFPELAIYKGLLFEIGDENKNFNKSMYNVTWDEAIIKDGNKKGENYLLTLKKAANKYDLIVYPVLEGKDYDAALKKFQDKFKEYAVALDKRKENEKKIEVEYQAKIAALIKQQEDIERKWKEDQDNNFRTADTEQKVVRMFAISHFGVFNCDVPSVYPRGVLCAAQLTNDRNTKLMCYSVFLVDKEKNGLFTYYKNPIARFSFNPKSTNMIWTVENGVLYWLKPDQFAAITSSDNLNKIALTRVDQKFKTADELKAYFNF